jgi:hypothetical protein
MKDFGSINPMEAMRDLGIMRLAARISDLKDKGIPVARRMQAGKNRYGQSVSYAVYYLEEVTI